MHFSTDSRNVSSAQSIERFELFKHGASHSIWLVKLVVYNVSPWMSMKQSYFIMPLLILGPTSPGNNIDVYLCSLIDELNKLWTNSVNTYNVRTISDFLAYRMLSGWSTKGLMVCSYCQEAVGSTSLSTYCSICYMGHRRFLPAERSYRSMKG